MKSFVALRAMLLAPAALLLGGCGGPGAFSVPAEAPPAGRVKVISYNIRQSGQARKDGPYRWSKRRHASVNMALEQMPSLLCIQEGLIGQVRYLEEHLPQYARAGVGRDDGRDGGEIMAIFYLREPYELLGEGTFWLSDTPDTVSRGWDAACNRTVTWVHLRERASGRRFWCFNTHLDHRGRLARERSVELLASRIEEMVDDDAALFLTGDMNAPIDAELFAPLLRILSPAREQAKVSDGLGTFNGFGTAPNTIVVDHIFYRAARPLEFATLTGDYGAPYISDHYPVAALFAID